MRSLIFDQQTLSELEAGFDRACSKKQTEVDPGRRDLFIRRLDSLAAHAPEWRALEDRKHKERRRAIEKLAKDAKRLEHALRALDGDAAAWILRKYAEMTEGQEFAEQRNVLELYVIGMELREDAVKTLGAWSEAAFEAEKDLPNHKANSALGIALGLERCFWEYGFDFAASNTGFAGQCLAAIYEAGGMEKGNVQYWIEQARSHPDSMSSYLKRQHGEPH